MRDTLSIYHRKDGVLVSIDTSEFYDMYDYLTGIGFQHEEAEDIACWAENAPDGAEYSSSKDETYQIFVWCE